MVTINRTYRGHRLTARQESAGWIVDIGGTSMRSSRHSSAASAFDEARRYIDALKGQR